MNYLKKKIITILAFTLLLIGIIWVNQKKELEYPLTLSGDLLFTSNMDTGNRQKEIYMIDLSESEITRITKTEYHHFLLGTEKQNRYLVVTRAIEDTNEPEGLGDEDKKSLWIIDLETGIEKQLTENQAVAEGDSLNPDGEWIVFWMQQTPETSSDIYKIRKDGSNLTQLTNTPHTNEFDPQWSNRGDKIAYISYNLSVPRFVLKLMDSNGQNIDTVYDGRDNVSTPRFPPGVYDPSWSPDDQWLVFEKPVLFNGENGDAGVWHIFRIRVDGTGLRDLSEIGGHDTWAEYLPSFSLDGQSLVFSARFESSNPSDIIVDVFTMDIDGGSLKRITESDAVNDAAIWIK